MNAMRKHRILCTCDLSRGATSGYRVNSLRRLGQEVIPFQVLKYLPSSKYLNAIAVRAPFGPVIHRINYDLLRTVREYSPDIVFFDRPTQFTPETIRAVKEAGATTVYFNQDNPFGSLQREGWYQLRRAFQSFDLYCAIRNTDVVRFQRFGLPWVRIMLSFEPSVHFPPPSDWSDENRPRDVSYIGSPYDDRPAFLQQLAEKEHIPLSIGGTLKWKRFLSPQTFARHVVDGPLLDTDYREGIWKSKINLSFLTHLNEEDIAHKSVEIAACQGFLMALRCEGHQAIFEEDKEAVFFSSVEECADKCRFYLSRPDLREAIARRGRERAVRSGYDNDTQLARVLNRLDGTDV